MSSAAGGGKDQRGDRADTPTDEERLVFVVRIDPETLVRIDPDPSPSPPPAGDEPAVEVRAPIFNLDVDPVTLLVLPKQ